MIIICAWCEQDGTKTLIQARSSDHRKGLVSHGICPTHAALTRDSLRQNETALPKPQHSRSR